MDKKIEKVEKIGKNSKGISTLPTTSGKIVPKVLAGTSSVAGSSQTTHKPGPSRRLTLVQKVLIGNTAKRVIKTNTAIPTQAKVCGPDTIQKRTAQAGGIVGKERRPNTSVGVTTLGLGRADAAGNVSPVDRPSRAGIPHFMWSTESSRQRKRGLIKNTNEKSGVVKPLARQAQNVSAARKLVVGIGDGDAERKNSEELKVESERPNVVEENVVPINQQEEVEVVPEECSVSSQQDVNIEECSEHKVSSIIDDAHKQIDEYDDLVLKYKYKAELSLLQHHMREMDRILVESNKEKLEQGDLPEPGPGIHLTPEEIEEAKQMAYIVYKNLYEGKDEGHASPKFEANAEESNVAELKESEKSVTESSSLQAEYSIISDASLPTDCEDEGKAGGENKGCQVDFANEIFVGKENETPVPLVQDNFLKPAPPATPMKLAPGRGTSEESSPQLFFTPQGKYASASPSEELDTPVTALGSMLRQLDLNNV